MSCSSIEGSADSRHWIDNVGTLLTDGSSHCGDLGRDLSGSGRKANSRKIVKISVRRVSDVCVWGTNVVASMNNRGWGVDC